MLISVNWINEFTPIGDIDVNELANDFTMRTAEVEAVEIKNDHLEKIKIAQIMSIRPHPEADKLNLVTFDDGSGELKEVVCGAPNVREGLKVPYACIGVTLPNGLTLEPKKIRGIESQGMLCSETELGLGSGSSGLMELASEAKLGQTMAEYLGLSSDTIIDIDNKSLTHRPDLWGMYGMAREFAAIYQKNLKDPFDAKWISQMQTYLNEQKAPITPKVEDSSCLIYLGLSIDNINVTSSPSWLASRLESVGLRSINSIVDISNYVMLELGMPLHIFDRDKIEGDLIIKRLNQDASFITLDEVKRDLVGSDTVICDQVKPLVLAGIMGGMNSGVDENTKNIFIEVANWKAEEVRQTSTRLGLRTDSSSRYEKTLDSQQCFKTMLRTMELVLSLCPQAKVVGQITQAGPELSPKEPLIIKSSFSKINKTLGVELTPDRIVSILEALSFKCVTKEDSLVVEVPSFRATKDIEVEADVIEEVGRIIGYDSIAAIAPLWQVAPVRHITSKSLQYKITDFMSLQAQSLEIMTYPLIGSELLEKSAWPILNDELKLVNALTHEADRMRPSLIPSALQVTSINAKNYTQFRFFEIGRSYLPCAKNFSLEKNNFIAGFYSKVESSILAALNVTEKLLNYLALPFEIIEMKDSKFENPLVASSWLGLHPIEFFSIKIMGRFMGAVFTVHPMILRNFKIKGNLSLVCLDLSQLEVKPIQPKINYRPINKFPQAVFDCSIVMDSSDKAVNAVNVVRKIKSNLLASVKIVDVFNLDASRKSVTLRSTFENKLKTLDPAEIKSLEQQIISTLQGSGYPLKEV